MSLKKVESAHIHFYIIISGPHEICLDTSGLVLLNPLLDIKGIMSNYEINFFYLTILNLIESVRLILFCSARSCWKTVASFCENSPSTPILPSPSLSPAARKALVSLSVRALAPAEKFCRNSLSGEHKGRAEVKMRFVLSSIL